MGEAGCKSLRPLEALCQACMKKSQQQEQVKMLLLQDTSQLLNTGWHACEECMQSCSSELHNMLDVKVRLFWW